VAQVVECLPSKLSVQTPVPPKIKRKKEEEGRREGGRGGEKKRKREGRKKERRRTWMVKDANTNGHG
jgi:hypothetical protein